MAEYPHHLYPSPENPDHPDATLNPEHGIALFTDGSCWTGDEVGAWAWVAVDAFDGCDWDSGYCSHSTISQMELLAVSYGLKEIDNRYGAQDVLVFSDSEYVVLGYNDPSRKRNKNKDYWTGLMNECSHHKSVVMEHVRGHDGNEINELADKLASKARKEGQEHYERKRINLKGEGQEPSQEPQVVH